MRATAFALAFSLFGLTSALASTARATTNFPPATKKDLGLQIEPACDLCHTTGDKGGRGTVNTPFGKSMRGLGLVGFDEASLSAALSESAARKIDSDHDCTSDIDELRANKDPNVATGTQTCGGGGDTVLEPRYGCGANMSSRAPGGAGVALTVALSVLVARRRRAQG